MSEHVVEALVPQLKVELGSDVRLRLQHLQTHAAEHSMECRQKEEQLLSKPGAINNERILFC